MKRSRVLLALPILLLATAAVLAAWAYARRGYPAVVYYRRSVIVLAGGSRLSTQPITVALWVDADHARLVAHLVAGSWRGVYVVRADRYVFGGMFSTGSLPLTRQASGDLSRYCRELLRGGFRGVDAAQLTRAVGRVTPVSLFGHPALRFATLGADDPALDLTFGPYPTAVWIDARTRHPLQRQFALADGTTVTERVTMEQRLPANTLPVDFFDSPGTRRNPWDRALGWVRDRLAGR